MRGYKIMKKIFTIVQTNDVHNALNDNGIDRIGFAKLYTFVNELRAKGDCPVYFVDCGDMFEEMPIFGDISDKTIHIVNKMDYDILSIGNHELDLGFDAARDRQNRLKANSAIVLNKDKSITGSMIQYHIDADTSISFIGAISCETFKKSPDSLLYDVAIMSPYRDVAAIMEKMSYSKNHFVAVMSHLGGKQKECSSKELATKLPRINLIMDGHDHKFVNTMVNGVTITSGAKYLRGVSVIDVYLSNGSFIIKSNVLRYNDFKDVTPDKEIEDMVQSLLV